MSRYGRTRDHLKVRCSSLPTFTPKSIFEAEAENEFSERPPNATADAVRSCAPAVAGSERQRKNKGEPFVDTNMDVSWQNGDAEGKSANEVQDVSRRNVRGSARRTSPVPVVLCRKVSTVAVISCRATQP